MNRRTNMYLCNMFVRKRKNRSGSTSVVVVDKSSGHFKEVKSFGSSSDATEIASLEEEARQYIANFGG